MQKGNPTDVGTSGPTKQQGMVNGEALRSTLGKKSMEVALRLAAKNILAVSDGRNTRNGDVCTRLMNLSDDRFRAFVRILGPALRPCPGEVSGDDS